MTWADPAFMEQVAVVGTGQMLDVMVSEHAPTVQAGTSGQTMQRIKLLLLSGARLTPPTRLVVRGAEVRVLGTQAAPAFDAPSIVTCELVNPDLPDDVTLLSVTKAMDDATGRFEVVETILWTGVGHAVSDTPSTVEAAGEDAPVDKIILTVPLEAPYAEGTQVRVSGMPGDDFTMSGELLDSTASLRRVVCCRLGR